MEWILRAALSLAQYLLNHLAKGEFKEVYEAVESAIELGQAGLSGNLTRAHVAKVRKEFNEALIYVEGLL